jgi:superfamily I DNA and/or RNA helicase
MNGPMEELQQLLQVWKWEWEADLEDYKTNILQTPLHERRKQGMSWYPVVVTESGFGIGDRLYLEIEKTTDQYVSHYFSSGKPVTLFSNSGDPKNPDAIQGVVASVTFNRMRIIFNEDELPDWLDDGKLGVNVLFDETSYREMEHALKKVMEAKNNRTADVRDVLLGYKKPGFTKDFVPILPSLNESQNRAVTNALQAQDVAIIHGPPGTGKTTTLVEAILLTLKTEKQVLVCAQSNAAVDLLTEKLSAKGLDVIRVGNPARVNEDLLRHTVEAKLQADKSYVQLKQFRKQADEFNRLAYKYKRQFGKAERDQRKLILAEARKLSKEANDTEKYITESLFAKAQVITCTLVGAINRFLIGKTFRTVFIDEAAQALEPACWIPILKADKVVFAGDHCQLPPTVKSQKASKAGLSVTLFEKCMQRQQVDVMLQTQYRMHEQIMTFSSREFYKNALIADVSVKEAVLGIDELLAQPFTFIDTAGCGFEEKFNPQNQSLSNPEEGILLLRHLEQLAEQLQQEQPGIWESSFKIGIISPYRAQVEYLQEQLPTFTVLSERKKSISINTVDAFQGQEREVIYISLVRSNDKSEIGFLADIRRMNVALTRAKRRLVVVGDSATLANHPFYKDFMDYVEEVQAYRSAWDYIQ